MRNIPFHQAHDERVDEVSQVAFVSKSPSGILGRGGRGREHMVRLLLSLVLRGGARGAEGDGRGGAEEEVGCDYRSTTGLGARLAVRWW